MSVPFAGATISASRGGVRIRIVQIATDCPWRPATLEPLVSTSFALGRHHRFVLDIFEITRPTGKIAYTRVENSTATTLEVRYHVPGTEPVVGISACNNVWTEHAGVTKCLNDIDVMFHVGDNVYADPLFKRWQRHQLRDPNHLLDEMAALYIRSWHCLALNTMEHRIIPDDHDWTDNSTIEALVPSTAHGKTVQEVQELLLRTDPAHSHATTYFRTVTRFLDLLGYVINGVHRKCGEYYTATLETKRTKYLAISNWLPSEADLPESVSPAEIVEDLLESPSPKKDVVLIFSRGCLPITQHLDMNILLYGDESISNQPNYRAFAELKQKWDVNLTVACGDLHLPISLHVKVKLGKCLVEYDLHSTGTLNNVSELHEDWDFDQPEGCDLRVLVDNSSLVPSNSYLKVRGSRVETVAVFQDLFTAAEMGLRFAAACKL